MDRLPESAKQAARRAYRQFASDPSHPSLRFKKLRGFDVYWSVRVTLDLRAVGQRDGDRIAWFWIGTHAEFDRLFA
ncbi:MAG: hypothetical protein AAGK78_07425 [Planctomycetota bacterium]